MPFPRAMSVPLPVPGPAAPLPHAASSARGAASAGATRRLAIVDVFFRQGGQLGTRIQRRQLLEAADRPAVDEDLRHGAAARAAHEIGACLGVAAHVDLVEGHAARPQQSLRAHAERAARRGVHLDARHRSEEHTSELQSRLHLVCRLLLEKKKKNTYTYRHTTQTP